MAADTKYSVEDVAKELDVHPDTVRRWIRRGELQAIDLGGSAGYRITRDALDRFLQERSRRPQD